MNSPTILSQLGRLTWAQGNGRRDLLRNLFASRKSVVLSGEKKMVANGVIHLPRGSVQRIDHFGNTEVSVLHGVFWLTATPAEGDILLHAGSSFRPRGSSPVVVEALTEDASLLVHR